MTFCVFSLFILSLRIVFYPLILLYCPCKLRMCAYRLSPRSVGWNWFKIVRFYSRVWKNYIIFIIFLVCQQQNDYFMKYLSWIHNEWMYFRYCYDSSMILQRGKYKVQYLLHIIWQHFFSKDKVIKKRIRWRNESNFKDFMAVVMCCIPPLI